MELLFLKSMIPVFVIAKAYSPSEPVADNQNLFPDELVSMLFIFLEFFILLFSSYVNSSQRQCRRKEKHVFNFKKFDYGREFFHRNTYP